MKKLLALALVLAMLFSFTACAELGALQNLAKAAEGIAADAEKWEKMSEQLTNFKITIESASNNGEKEIFTEMRCDKGFALIGSNYIYFVDFDSNKMYTLNPSEKSGFVMTYTGDKETGHFGAATYGFLFFSSAYRFLGAKKDGSEKINGRKATVYSYNADGEDIKFWVDDEYGITVKYSVQSKDSSKSMEVTEFKTGGVKLSDMVNLSEYEITDYDTLMESYGNF